MSGGSRPFTVAIPTYNGSRFIEAALASALAQEGVAFDLVVSDDRSDDDTLDRVRRVAGDRALIKVNAERLGLAGNWNRCVALARTPFVAILHQDDLIDPGHLAAHLAAFREGTGLVASMARAIDEQGRPAQGVEAGGCGPADRRFPPGSFAEELAVANPLRCSAVSVRAEVHASVGGFDPSFRYVVDWDFWLRVSTRWEVAWLARTTAAFRWHASSETHAFAGGTIDLEEASRLLDRIHGDRPDLAPLRTRADRVLARAHLHRAYQAAKAGRGPLVRRCLGMARALHPGIVLEIARDPRLAARLAGSLLGRRGE
ncbi:MAG TPA: glycosyltransferase [Isosphaeraceae bacterium]|jgi:glycosyltransferase involved in cell wall biosynthesis